MNWKEVAKKSGKVVLIVGLLALFFIPTLIAMKYVALWQIYGHFVDTVSNVIGLNKYLITAASVLLFVPFYVGIRSLLSITNKRRRYAGMAILLTLVTFYNLGLFYFTRDAYFAFGKGEALKWYALTPDGVKFYDRPGVDPTYGIPLKPVTPDVVTNLRKLQSGEFKPIDPHRVPFFNPITGEAQVWYYQYPDGSFEFYDKPGYHPVTGTPLKPATQQVYFEWKQMEKPKSRSSSDVPARPASGPTAEKAVEKVDQQRVEPAKPPRPAVEVRSNPDEADVYLDWVRRGRTPLRLENGKIAGLLVVVKEGHQAYFRHLSSGENVSLDVNLQVEGKRPRTRILLFSDFGEGLGSLKNRLVEEGFSVLGSEEAREFQRELNRAGGLSNTALRAWARAKFGAGLLLKARFQRSSRELSDQELGYLGIREAVKGAIRAEVVIDLEAIDLGSGEHLTAFSSKGSSFSLDRAQAFQMAASQAANESAKLLRQRIRG